MIRYLLALLLGFLRPGVEGEGADQAPQDPPNDPQPELDLDPADAEQAPEVDPKVELETARREARELKEANDRYQRELAEARASRQQPVQNDDWAREEQILKDPNASPQDKWKVQADRTLRETTQGARLTLAQAQDLADQTAFQQLSISEPALHKRYSAKVEEELGNARRQGYNPKREYIYNQLIAKDMRDGKFKKKTAPAKDQASPSASRGKLPGARSDVSARSTANEHEKRIERLRNQQI